MPRTKNREAHPHLRSGRWITEAKRFAIYLRDGMKCVYCQSDLSELLGGTGAVLDHVVAGAGNDQNNLVTACKFCNDTKQGDGLGWCDPATQGRVTRQLVAPIDTDAGQALYERLKSGKAAPLPGPSVAAMQAERSGHKARKDKAEADSAEMEAAHKVKKLCWRADYLDNWKDAIAQGVRAIGALSSLTDAQKQDVFGALRSIRLPDLEE